jgi:hypothetical protein
MEERFSEIREWLAAAERDPDRYLPPRSRTLWTREELFDLFRRYAPETPLSVDAFGRGLKALGRHAVNVGEPVRTCDGVKRLFAMRNREHLQHNLAPRHLTRVYNEERCETRRSGGGQPEYGNEGVRAAQEICGPRP